MSEKKKIKRDRVRREVENRGSRVLQNKYFYRCMEQKHHNNTVGNHSLGVAEDSLIIADVLEKIGFQVNRDALVRSSLCHDWGMLDRYKKYNSDVHTCIRHPGESLRIAEKEYPDLTPEEKDSILHHMFPVLPIAPHTLEGLIVCIADKKSSIREEIVQRDTRGRL